MLRFFSVKYVINSGVQPLSNWHNQVTFGMENGTIVFLTVYSDADQRKHQSSVSLAFVRGIHRGPVNSPHKWPVTRKMFPFDDVIMYGEYHMYMELWNVIAHLCPNFNDV